MRARSALFAVALAVAASVPLSSTAGATITATPKGQIFLPNPVVSQQDRTLTDQKDSEYAALEEAYRTVGLTNLDGSGFLNGDFVDVCGTTSCAYSATGQFVWGRSDDRFEQVMAYYAITQAQLYIQSLGFTNIHSDPLTVKVDQWGNDNSYYDTKLDQMRLGKGGVDDGEDLEVIWHEYGHAIQNSQVDQFGVNHDSNSIGEGFGDYWAFTMSEPVSGGFDPACIADWDSISYTTEFPGCLRRVDTNLTMADQNGRIHHDGMIWSRALYDIHNALGRTTADKIILQAQFSFAAGTSFRDAALATVSAAQSIAGKGTAVKVTRAFHDRGIL